MTAVMLPDEARLSASTITSSSMMWSLAGGLVGWMTKVSSPRTFSSISTWISPSEKRLTTALESGRSKSSLTALASAGFAFPVKILKSLLRPWDIGSFSVATRGELGVALRFQPLQLLVVLHQDALLHHLPGLGVER